MGLRPGTCANMFWTMCQESCDSKQVDLFLYFRDTIKYVFIKLYMYMNNTPRVTVENARTLGEGGAQHQVCFCEIQSSATESDSVETCFIFCHVDSHATVKLQVLEQNACDLICFWFSLLSGQPYRSKNRSALTEHCWCIYAVPMHPWTVTNRDQPWPKKNAPIEISKRPPVTNRDQPWPTVTLLKYNFWNFLYFG